MESLLTQRLEFFKELISCGQNLYLWEFNPSFQLISTNCPDAELFKYYFFLNESDKYLKEHMENGNFGPVLVTNNIDLSWIAAFETAGRQVCRIYMIGPVFTSDISLNSLKEKLLSHAYPRDMIAFFQEKLQHLPIIPVFSWMQYGLMLHYCVSGQKLDISDYNYEIHTAQSTPSAAQKEDIPAIKNNVWLAEQTAMQMIEEGRLDYQTTFGELAMSINSTSLSAIQSLRDHKNQVISFITLSTRAAIRGGLNAESAYYLGNYYINLVEKCSGFADIIRVNNTMYDDFLHRVHRIRSERPVSDRIQACFLYIDTHLSEKISVSQLAREAGYSEYYLAAKFKKETGMNVVEYVQNKRIEKSRLLLRSTQMSIQEIADEVGFCNASYFAKNFRKAQGISPAEYRSHKQMATE